jgi:hypothetical protein
MAADVGAGVACHMAADMDDRDDMVNDMSC